MSARTKKHLVDRIAKISWHGSHYAVPDEIMERDKVKSDNEDYTAIDNFFLGDLTQY